VAEPRLIANYKAILSAELPLAFAEEVGDGLGEAYAKYRRLGMAADDAAQAAVGEFGNARAVVEGFSRASAARRVAHQLLMTGPAVGLCWAAMLITSKAWDWPVPDIARLLLGGLLVASVIVLVTAVRAERYWTVRRSGAAGCIGLAVLDASLIMAVVASRPGLGSLAVIAILASAARLMCIARVLPRYLTEFPR
jgi:hypothetical protein